MFDQVLTYTIQNSGIQFGTAIDTPKLYYANVSDIKGMIIKVGYTNQEITINDLIETYKQVANIRLKGQDKIYFKILSGEYKDMLAFQAEKLSFYDFDLNPSFQVIKESEMSLHKELFNSNAKYQQIQNKNKEIHINAIALGNRYKVKLRYHDKIQKIKEKIKKECKEIEDINNNHLTLMIKGIFINDLIKDKYLNQNCEINVVIKQKLGCFQRNQKVIIKRGQKAEQIKIQQIKIDDEILTYNQSQKQYQFEKVTYVSKYMLDQYLKIELSNGKSIKTTGNHLFLCQDNLYRKCQRSLKYQKDQQSTFLQIGTKMKLYSQDSSQIKSIDKIYLPEQQPFYHLSINNNHNFVVNCLIAHNMFVNIVLPDGSVQKIDITPAELIINIKEKLQEIYSIQAHSQALFFAGKIIQDYQTLADKNIPKESNIYLRYKPVDDFNFLHPSTKVLLSNGTQKPIQKIEQGQKIICGDGNHSTVLCIQTKSLNNYMSIKVDTQQDLIITNKDCYLELQDGTSVNIFDICYQIDDSKQICLKRYNGDQYCVVKGIDHHKSDNAKKFYKLLMNDYSEYVCNGCIVNNSVLNVVVFKKNKRIRKICLPFRKSDTVYHLKQKLAKLIVFQGEIELSFNGMLLQDKKYLSIDYNLDSSNILIANAQKLSISSSLIITSKSAIINKENKIFILQVSYTEIISLEYNKYSEKNISSIISELMPKFISSSYFLVFGEIIILPFEKLQKLELSKEFQSADNTILLIKNQKLAFLQNMQYQGFDMLSSQFSLLQNTVSMETIQTSSPIIKKKQSNQIKSKSEITLPIPHQLKKLFNETITRIKKDTQIQIPKQKEQAFFIPFLYYTSRKYKAEITNYIKNFNQSDKKTSYNNAFEVMVKELYTNMLELNNYYGECYFGIRNFRFSRFYKVNHVFYWLKFTSAAVERKEIQAEISKNKGTIFIIYSINGKNISPFSLYPSTPQILFTPFTYFMVQKIQIKQKYDIVYLSEMSSPITFEKNIILWVDDKAQKNAKEIKKHFTNQDIQILQVRSTALAINWVKQFGWLLNWKGFNFKLISNMTRVQNLQPNNSAGVDLLEKLYTEYGITAETLIFCLNEKEANQKIKQRNIRHNRFQVTSKIHKFLQFCKLNPS